ncbi:threonine/serine ThrE exporter family protein [Actinocorallia sp. A-T 12471]|uniref:threonine/serine ThrE exporter family protein n=1 Tax=Actinocorallia sp. A-T 12471 TaxID=3089813 RepID=UPI0029D22055|nr:threonine/serine exporter family protein [Actinocorallia sp. A-T 12471]MDX6738762.1 threonine/serine exporter family protein [Actinocorallia sp. A-T 12471]
MQLGILHRYRERSERDRQRERDFAEDEQTTADKLHGGDYGTAELPPARTVDEPTATRALRVMLRLGRGLFVAGAETGSIRDNLVAMAAAWGMDHVQVDIAGRSVHAQYAPPGARPLTMFTTLPVDDGWNLGNLTRLSQLADRTIRGRLSVPEVESELDDILAGKGGRPLWTSLLGGCLVMAMLSLVIGGTPWAAILAMGAFVVWAVLTATLSKAGTPYFFVMAIVAAVLGLLAVGLVSAGLAAPREVASMLAANLAILLPVLTVVSVSQDAVNGFRSLAADRTVSIAMTTVAIFTALLAVALLAPSLADDFASTSATKLPPIAALPLWAFAAFGCCMMLSAPTRVFGFAIAAAITAGLIQTGAELGLGMRAGFATFAAAAVLGLIASLAAPLTRVPARSILLPAIAGSILPTPQIYATFVAYSQGRAEAVGQAAALLVVTAAIGLGGALGTFTGGGLSRWAAARRIARRRAAAAEGVR